MDRSTFYKLCDLLKNHGGLKESKNMFAEERVAIFLNMLGHDQKQRLLVRRLRRSKETITRNFRQILRCVLRLHNILLKTPEPIPEDSNDERWKWFKKCLRALDGTFIDLRVQEIDKPRYQSRKGDISTNVLTACSVDMEFTYVLPGWEGSAADSRILKDALLRTHSIKIPRTYYLVYVGYTNGEDFLAPYRGQRYHLKEWKDGYKLRTSLEYFNMKHSATRNVIESFYEAETHADIISSCCLLHNLIRREMKFDPLEPLLDIDYGRQFMNGDDDGDNIDVVESSIAWTL
ncbi:uncharacterized protein LOC130810871 [Amaranthus tricolor]|uniref:uncharacterized protein LOC130810871 n=1 Tax=Amaranthus tricolor TaxID=29722 RepID=UPI00258C3BFB|nr:uncharacterized protein LOC130810871 [Amaranthus tricolor]